MPIFVVTIAVPDFLFTLEAPDREAAFAAAAVEFREHADDWDLPSAWTVHSAHETQEVATPEFVIYEGRITHPYDALHASLRALPVEVPSEVPDGLRERFINTVRYYRCETVAYIEERRAIITEKFPIGPAYKTLLLALDMALETARAREAKEAAE